MICSILEGDADATARRIREAPTACALLEVRADELPAEALREVVASSHRPLLVAVRRPEDGGRFRGSEEQRRGLLSAALEAGAAFVDVERGSELEGWALKRRSRVVLSDHGAPCSRVPLQTLYRAMADRRCAAIKLVPRARAVQDTVVVRELLEQSRREAVPLIAFALGRAGAISRVLGPSWGSLATYGSVAAGRETGEGQYTAADLLRTFDVLRIGPTTRRYALLGQAVFSSPSPAMHRAGFQKFGIDCCYLPIELDEVDGLFPLLGREGPFGIEALAVTLPFKEVVARHCRPEDDVARSSGAVNTVLLGGTEGWLGYNTDGPGALASIAARLDPVARTVAIVGGGGTALAVGSALSAAGAHVTLYTRDSERGRRAAKRIGACAADLGSLSEARWDVLVNATPLGRNGERLPLGGALAGKLVLDAVYRASPTPLILRARKEGLATLDGVDLLAAQAVLQFERMNGLRVEARLLLQRARRWLAERETA